eukprot:TRINITY_DN13403_c0_g1_i1.p1 TRINITY_DN13403_c0_g1~~TRINITY_DN13403_c0_g1_i1.p1  ORF type:complete len:790 (-),score=81.43 TRINITY_DN13403_c0_g1_i1:363-2450(-)
MGEFLVDDQWDSILNDPHVLDEHESGSLAGDSSTDSPLARLGKSLLPNGPQRNSDPPSNLNVSIQTSANVAAGNPLGATPAGVPGTEGPVVPLNHLSVDVSVGGSDHVGQCTTSTLTDAVVVDFSISSLLLTRAQWYNVEVKFSNSQGRPLFAGRSVTIDEAISFEDSRKRIVGKGETEKEPLVVSVVGVCSSTGKAISKCNKCKEQDTVTTKRKRRRDSYESWTEVDKSNNSKLCQILETGCHAVEEDGTLRLRFRVMCCVGASRQYHKNHLSHSMEEIHSGCQGLGVTLQVSSREKNFSTVSKSLAQPIRIVGKAKTNNDKPPPADAENGSARLFTRQRLQTINLDPNPTKLPQQQLQTPTPVASTPIPGPATTVPPRSYKNPLSCAEKMKYICEFYEFVGQPIDDFISMHKLVKSYLDLIKPEFHLSYRAIFEPDFFMISNLMNIPIESPQMLHTFNTIAVIDKLKKRGKRQEQFFTKINKLRDQLLRTIDVNELPYDEALLFCDSIARSSVCNIFKGEFEIGRDVLDVAYKLYLSVKWTEIRKTSSFSFLMYLRASFIYDAPHLQDIYQWAENHTYQSIRTRIVSSNFISMCFPDFHKLDQHKQVPILGFPPKMQSELLHILQKLENTMYKEGFFSKSTSSTCASYATLSRCVLSALRNWILWDIPAAAVNIEECAVQVPLGKHLCPPSKF